MRGRHNGMPAFGSILPNDSIWKLVAYIKTLSSTPAQTGQSDQAIRLSMALDNPLGYLRSLGPAADPINKLGWGLITISLLAIGDSHYFRQNQWGASPELSGAKNYPIKRVF